MKKLCDSIFLYAVIGVTALVLAGCGGVAYVQGKVHSAVEGYCEKSPSERKLIRHNVNQVSVAKDGGLIEITCPNDPDYQARIQKYSE